MVEAPPGGPVDETPPWLLAAAPDSGADGVGPVDRLEFTFSEKMDRTGASSWLRLFPESRFLKTSWKGALTATVELEAPLPADTVVVVEIAGTMKDVHKVPNARSRRYPIFTGPRPLTGSISGALVMNDTAVTRGAVELFSVPPETLAYFQQPILRRVPTDNRGFFELDWLPVPGGPWLVRAFADGDGNLRPGEKEAQRLLPDTLSLSLENPFADSGKTILFPPDTPGRLLTGPLPDSPWPGNLAAFALIVAEEDSGYVPGPVTLAEGNIVVLDPAGGSILEGVGPGPVRMIMFADVDRDSSFGFVPDSLFADVVSSSAGWDTVSLEEGEVLLEPWSLYDGLSVLPGLDTPLAIVSPPDSLTIILGASAPLAEVTGDSLLVAPDSLSIGLPDSLTAPSIDGP